MNVSFVDVLLAYRKALEKHFPHSYSVKYVIQKEFYNVADMFLGILEEVIEDETCSNEKR